MKANNYKNSETVQRKRPFKISDVNEREKFGIVAATLDEVRQKGKLKLNLPDGGLTVLLQDGTVVDDEDYFSCLENNTVLILKTSTETFSPVSSGHYDAVDSSLQSEKKSHTRAAELAQKLRSDMHSIMYFSPEELESVANASLEELQVALPDSKDEIERLQEACHNHLLEKEKTREALILLKLCNPSEEDQPDSEYRNKRFKT